jgi:ceramide synthetase
MIELAFYWSLIFSQFIDVKRKDFWQMFIHHIATISLLSFSYIVNFVRVGTLVLIIHDCGDYWLEVRDKNSMIFIYIFIFSRVQKWQNTHEHKKYVIHCS